MASLSPQDMNRFGSTVDSAEEAGLMIVGNEFSEINGCARKDFIITPFFIYSLFCEFV